MVAAIRAGRSVRAVAASFGVSVSTVAYWVDQVHGKRLDRVSAAANPAELPYRRVDKPLHGMP
jgi:transposase